MKKQMLMAIIIAMAFTGCSKKPAPKIGEVVLVVTGSASAGMMTYIDGSGSLAQETAPIPWVKGFAAPYGAYVSVPRRTRKTKGQ